MTQPSYLYWREMLVALVLTFSQFGLTAQGLIPDSRHRWALQELEKRGIDPEEFRLRLEQRGISYERLDKMESSELALMQDDIEKILIQLETEKNMKFPKKSAAPSAIQTNVTVTERQQAPQESQSNEQVPVSMTDSTKPFQDIKMIWGHHLFRDKGNWVFGPDQSNKVPDHYVLGTGDRLLVNIWGISQLNQIYEIGKDGYINPDRMPRVFVRGLTLEKARKVAAAAFRRFYQFSENQFDLSLNQAREIQVNLVGELVRPGSYVLSARNHVVNALAAAGGPTDIGSVRYIKIIRKGKEIPVDLYRFLDNPVVEKDFFLEENDYILVPVIRKKVEVSGAVNRPALYELLDSEDLNKAIQYAGGLKEDAITRVIQLDRYQNDRRIILDVPYRELQEKKSGFGLQNGDRIVVFSVQTEAEDFIFVKGAVRSESSYGYRMGMMLSDLVTKLEFTPRSDLKNSHILRNNPDFSTHFISIDLKALTEGDKSKDIPLMPGDEIVIKRLSEYFEKSFVVVSGAARNPGRFFIDADGKIRLRDLITLAGGLKDEAWKFGYLFRVNLMNKTEMEILRVDLSSATDPDQNPILQKFDSLVILSEEEFSDAVFVDISGAVNKPGRYQYGRGMTAFDLISISDGFSFSASPQNIDIYRVVIKEGQPTKTLAMSISGSRNLKETRTALSVALQPYDIVVVRNQPGFNFQKMVTVEGEVLFPGQYGLVLPNERVADVIRRSGGLTPEAFPAGATLYRVEDQVGFIVMNLEELMKKRNSKYNFILKDGDRIRIPKQKDLVQIAGETNVLDLYPDKMISSNKSVAVAYHKGRRAKFYIDRYAAGVNERGDRRKITVEHANGHVERTRNYLLFRLTPKVHKGSVILVGAKPIKTEKQKQEKQNPVDWEKVLTKTLTATTAIFTMVLTYNSIVK